MFESKELEVSRAARGTARRDGRSMVADMLRIGADVTAHTPLLDHNDVAVATQPDLMALDLACQRAIDRQLEHGIDASDAFGEDASPIAAADAGPPPGGMSIAYLIMGHRSYAHVTISRLVQVLWHAAHLFIVHLDARTDKAVDNALRERFAQQRNVRLMSRRRAVGWGAFSMVEVLLGALALSLEAAPGFDFFINLSDADVALRTAGELGHFLRGFRGRSFVSVKFPEADAMRYYAHAHMRRSTWLECEGEGFLIINQTAADFFGGDGRRCCYARSGPIVYAALPIGRQPPPEAPDGQDLSFYHGSQWVVLARNAVEWLVRDPLAVALASHLRLTYMADETFVQTALMASPLRASLVNHNLRYIDWPHGYGDPNAYWGSVDRKHVAGPMVLTPELFGRVTRSPALFARKVGAAESRIRPPAAYGLPPPTCSPFCTTAASPPVSSTAGRLPPLPSLLHRWTWPRRRASRSCVSGTSGCRQSSCTRRGRGGTALPRAPTATSATRRQGRPLPRRKGAKPPTS